MKHLWKRAAAFVLVLVLIVPLCLSCGDDEDKEGVTITIGYISDWTGVASPALRSVNYVTEDLVRYYNEEGLIPGVKIKLANYDNNYNPAKDIPGYEWCRERGAEVILAPLANTAAVAKVFAERDKVAVVCLSSSTPLVEPPGWVFVLSASYRAQQMTMLKWISEEHWDYTVQGRIPKVGFVAWHMPSGLDQERATRDYCQAHLDKFEWGGSHLPPVGTMTFGPEAEALKDCDYILVNSNPVGYFIRDYLAKGYDTQFVSDSAAGAYQGFFVDMLGWERLDGFLSLEICRQHPEQYPTVELAKKLLYEYRPGEAEEILDAGTGYCGGFSNLYCFFHILEKAIEEVGAEDFDGQAFYDAAAAFELQLEGCPKWWFSETERSFMHHAAVYEWRAEAEAEVRVSDWLPFVYE